MFPPIAPQPDAPTQTAQAVVSDQNTPVSNGDGRDEKTKKRHDDFRSRVDVCKSYRRKLIPNWTTNIDYRRGKPFTSQGDEDQVAVNLDWSLTKAKQSALFSQVPEVRLDIDFKTSPWGAAFQKKLNNILISAGIETAMDECLPDCINAAGIGVVLVSYDVIKEDKQMPKMDTSTLTPEELANVHATGEHQGQPVEMDTVPHILDHRYVVQRISPADFLWPVGFTGANFDNAPWIGRSGRVTWAEAVQKFGLTDADKELILGEDRPNLDRLTTDIEREKTSNDDMVPFDEIFYKTQQYDEGAEAYSALHHLVFVAGKEKPVVDEPWNGQKVGPDGITGSQKTPIRVLTFTYITDETIPPSDSAIGRPQVNEINKSRTQMIRQRERSLPIRWYDVNRVDPTIQQSLMRGTWQAMIPVQGAGDRVIGEVSQAKMPQDNFMFDKVAKADLQEEWTVNNTGKQLEEGEEGGDSLQNKTSFNTQVGRERAKVASFVVGISEVLGGLMCLYEDPQSLGQGFDPGFSKSLAFSILADSTVLLDVGQRVSRLNHFMNTYAKSGWIDVESVLQEIATLHGLDPAKVIRPPQPKPPVEPNISLRLTGVEDLLNPLALAFMIKSGQAPPQEMIEQAKALIQQAVVPPQGMQMPGQVQPLGGLPMLPQGAPGGAPGMPPGGGGGAQPPGPPLTPPVGGPPSGSPVPPPQPPKLGEAHPNWTVLPALNKRSEGGQG